MACSPSGSHLRASAFGPYQASSEPLVRDSRGAVDAHFFRAADGAQYLLWRTDGVVDAEPTTIEVQALTKDGLALTGSVTTLLTNSEPWEGKRHAAVAVAHRGAGGQYYLFYNANDPSREGLTVAVARAPAVTGPYTKARGPSLGSGGKWAGPGMGSVIRARDDSWLLRFMLGVRARSARHLAV